MKEANRSAVPSKQKRLEKNLTVAFTCAGGCGTGVLCRECGSQRQRAQDYPEGRLPVQRMLG